MHFLGFVIKIIGSIVAFAIAVKLAAFILGLLGLVLKLVWLVVCVGFFAVILYALYRLFAAGRPTEV